MLIALLAGTVVSMSSVACPPESLPSEGDRIVVPEMGQVVRLRLDEPAPGKVDCMGTPAAVKVSEAPFAEQFTEPMLGKVWVTTPGGVTMKEFAAAVGKGAEREVFVDWERLASAGVKPETTISVPLNHVYIETAMRIVNERVGGKVAARRTGDLVEISTQETFDKREKKTVSFDIRPLLAGMDAGAADAKVKELLGAMTSTIDPEGWESNGGDTSRSSMAEGRLFVVAPPRVQKAVAWFFGQVSDQPLAGVEVLRKGEPVQTLQIKPVQINAKNTQENELDAKLRNLRRELAWKKAALGVELTDADKAAMDDARAVKAVGLDAAERVRLDAQVKALQAEVERLQREVRASVPPTWREATQGAGDYRSFK